MTDGVATLAAGIINLPFPGSCPLRPAPISVPVRSLKARTASFAGDSPNKLTMIFCTLRQIAPCNQLLDLLHEVLKIADESSLILERCRPAVGQYILCTHRIDDVNESALIVKLAED